MYARSLETFVKLLPIIILVLVGDLILQAVKEVYKSKSLIFVETLLWSYLAYAAHAEFLLPSRRNKAGEGKRIIWFALRTFGLSVLIVIPIFMAIFTFRIIPFSSGGGSLEQTIMLIVIILMACVTVLSLLGTLLPAYVADRGRGFEVAFFRGISQFFWTAGHLIGGPVIVSIIGTLTFGGAMLYVGASDHLLGLDTYSTIITVIDSLLLNTIFSLSTIMTAWVLSASFKRSFNEEL